MRTVFFAYPGDLNTPTGGYGYDRRIIQGLRDAGWMVKPIGLGDGFPFPARSVLEAAEAQLAGLPKGALVVIDGLAFGVMDKIASRLAGKLRLVALVHHPLCRETGLEKETAERLLQTEQCAVGHAKQVIVTSKATADQVATMFSVPVNNIHIVLPGTDRIKKSTRPRAGPLKLLSVGTISPRKGYDLLFQALADLKHLDWQLDVVGSTTLEPGCFTNLLGQLEKEGLEGRVAFHGSVAPEELAVHYDAADIFVLASRYEGYGMAFTEAIAHGLPVIGSGAGAVEELLPEGASIFCGVEDIDRLKQALALLIADAQVREDMAKATSVVLERFPTWENAARTFSNVLAGIK